MSADATTAESLFPDASGFPGRGGQYLTFVLAGEEYGVPILQVREIIEFTRVTPVPMTTPWVLGILNLRGNVVPVVDLARRFALDGGEVSKRTCIVIVEVENGDGYSVLGVKVDAVREVADLTDFEIQDPPAFGARVAEDCLLGVGQTGDAFALLLDMNRVFPVAQIGDLEPIAAQQQLKTRAARKDPAPSPSTRSATPTDAPTAPAASVDTPVEEPASPAAEAADEEPAPEKKQRPRRRARRKTSG